MRVFFLTVLAAAFLVSAPYGFAQEEAPAEPKKKESSKPVFKIFGKEVVTIAERQSRTEQDALPLTWQDAKHKRLMAQRKSVPFYSHSPAIGNPLAPVTIVEMTDLSCIQCMETVRMIEKIRKLRERDVRMVHVHLPVDMYNATNPAAFYGRLASKSGHFWDYRARVIELTENSENIYAQTLIESGLDRDSLRKLIRDEARRSYKELDADTMMSKKINEKRPPVYYINGIRIDQHFTSAEILDLVDYEITVATTP